MTLLFSMLPLYLFGNLHCLGMCGPLVMMIGQHRYRYFYFLGRLLSFTLAGMAAGELGAVLNLALKQYHIPALACFFFGGFIILIGFYTIMGWQYPGHQGLARVLSRFNRSLSILMLQDKAWPSFLFGFFTIALPCGQTVVVYSACALSGDIFIGMINGFVFAVLTTPSLLFAMHTHKMLNQFKHYHNWIMGICSLLIGLLAILRGLAEINIIPHLILNPEFSSYYHIILY